MPGPSPIAVTSPYVRNWVEGISMKTQSIQQSMQQGSILAYNANSKDRKVLKQVQVATGEGQEGKWVSTLH